MAFDLEQTITATEIRSVVAILKDSFDEGGAPVQSAHYQVEIGRSDGSRVSRRGNLVGHITTAQRQALLDFMAALRTQAEEEFLP